MVKEFSKSKTSNKLCPFSALMLIHPPFQVRGIADVVSTIRGFQDVDEVGGHGCGLWLQYSSSYFPG